MVASAVDVSFDQLRARRWTSASGGAWWTKRHGRMRGGLRMAWRGLLGGLALVSVVLVALSVQGDGNHGGEAVELGAVTCLTPPCVVNGFVSPHVSISMDRTVQALPHPLTIKAIDKAEDADSLAQDGQDNVIKDEGGLDRLREKTRSTRRAGERNLEASRVALWKTVGELRKRLASYQRRLVKAKSNMMARDNYLSSRVEDLDTALGRAKVALTRKLGYVKTKAALVGAMTGPPGTDGKNGKDGERGARGYPGDKGPRGAPGPMGKSGPSGWGGRDGAPGMIGPKGDRGLPGPQGSQGQQGQVGRPGPIGFMGKGGVGKPGVVGPSGPAGPPGPSGPAGPSGVPGASIKGNPGNMGAAGLNGMPGQHGVSGPGGVPGAPGSVGASGVHYFRKK